MSLFNPLRVKIPFLIDIVMVSDPEQIRRIAESDAVDRLHAYPSAELPWWVRFYFRATRFRDDRRDLWFCPFESESNPTYEKRRAYLAAKVEESYSDADVKHIAELLRTGVGDEDLAHAMVQVVNRRFFGEDIPRPITRAAKHTLQKIGESVFPSKYRRAVKSCEEVLDYCQGHLDPGIHIVDVGHNIGEVVHSTAAALRRLVDSPDRSVEEIYTEHAPTPQVPRITVERSRFDGLLWLAAKPGKTVFILKVGEAAAATRDLRFTFGDGGDDRLCVFKDFFIGFAKDVQKELARAG